MGNEPCGWPGRKSSPDPDATSFRPVILTFSMHSRKSFSFSVFLCICACAVLFVGANAHGQDSSPAQHTQGAVSTGAAHPAVLDAEHRPITAGGFVDSGPVIFQDIAEKAGLSTWQHVMGTPEKQFILETVGSGVALLDYDNDGWLDIYLVNGSTYDALKAERQRRRMPRCSTTIMTAHSPMSQPKPE